MSKFIALMYHSLREHPTGRYSLSFSEFNAQVAWLRSEEFIVEGFAELGQRLMQGGFPERYVVITFDDGHDSDLRAAEILRKVGAQATFFLTREFCHTRKGFLDANGIKELSTLCSVGSHGVTHSSLSDMTEEQMRWELAESKKWLEDLLGNPVDTFSAPGGYISSKVVTQALDLGYNLLGNSVEWSNQASQVRAQRVVNRVPVRSLFQMPLFKRVVEADITLLLKRRLRAKVLELPKALLTKPQIERLRKMTFK